MPEFKTIIIAPNGIRELNPIGITKLKKTATLDNGPLFYYNETITGDITFIQDDFEHILQWERSNKRCQKATLIISELINGLYVEMFRIVIAPDDIKWNLLLCSCSLKIEVKDGRFSKFDQIKDVEYNLFSLASHNIIWNMDTPPAPGSGTSVIIWQVENAMWLFDAIEGILEKSYGSAMKVKSKFFGWNDTQSYSIGQNSKLTKLIIGHNSDIYKREFYSGGGFASATIMNATLNSILDTICYMFNCKCDFEEIDTFRIEHISYFDTVSSVSIDATVGSNLLLNDGRLKNYEYDNDGRYSVENFDPFINVDGGPVFAIGAPIVYDTCNSNNTNVLDKRSIFTPTIKYNASFVPGWDINEGMYIVALDGSNLPEIVTGYPFPGTTGQFNTPLFWGYLREHYHGTHKSYSKGTAFSTSTQTVQPATFQTKPFIVQKGIKISDCNNQTLLINASVTTLFGIGRVKKYSKEIGQSYAEVDVYFNQPAGIDLPAPVAVNDSYSLNVLFYPNIDTLSHSLPKLVDNDTPTTAAVYPEIKKTKNGASVNIKADGHFIYTPISGYNGVDEFDYYIINNGLTSTATCTITIGGFV